MMLYSPIQSKNADNSTKPQKARLPGFSTFLLKALLSAPFVVLMFLSSAYCLLAYIPATYYAFIQAPFMAWMPVFARIQPYLFLITFSVAAIYVRDRFKLRETRGIAAEFYFLGACGSVYLIWARPVQNLRNETLSFLWSLAFLLPVIVLGALEFTSAVTKIRNAREPLRAPSYGRVVAVALWVSLLSPGTTILRFAIARMPLPLNREEAIIWLWAAFTQVLLFLAAFGIIELVARAAERTAFPARTRYLGYTALAAITVAVAFFRIVLTSIPFQGTEAIIYSSVFSLAVVTVAGAVLLRVQARRKAGGESDPLSEPVIPAPRVSISILVTFTGALMVPLLIGVMDWHSLLEKTWAVMLWVISAILLVHPQGTRRKRGWAVLATVLLSSAALYAGTTQKFRGALFPAAVRDAAFQKYATFDSSYAADRDLLAPSESIPCNQNCEFIAHQTNIPPSAFVNVPDISLVEHLQPNTGPKPNIFVIVVDSLRRDYLSPYNPQVFFTPEIGAFAKESVAFTNAFTRYSGTTLSEPAIWSGILQLHKHYVQPYHRVNNLEKLIQADRYQSMVSVDTVLRVLLEPRPDLVELDQSMQKWTDLDFCSTQAQVTTRIAQQRSTAPVFMYTQPQNIHLVTLQKTAHLRPPRKQYSPFVDYYASELERLDGCFGNFVRSLKTQGLYENSIIVLTADHGEALDRMGGDRHAFSLKPEVIQIPLIIHVPKKVRQSWYVDPDQIAFNTDIAATLYELLGHGPVISRPEFGRPLFTRTREESEKYTRGSYLIASSYGFLYGLLSKDGKELFVDDRGKDEFFDLRLDPGATHALMTEEIRRNAEAALVSDIQAIANLYGYEYKPPGLLEWLTR